MARLVVVLDQITTNRGPPLYSGTELGDSWFDAITKLNAMMLELYSSVPATSGRVQRSITTSGDLPITGSDSILNVNNAGDLTPTIPLASGRTGAPLTIKNLPGSHIQTLQRTGSDTFDGLTAFILNPGASVTLIPYNDGVNAGYAIE